MKKLTSLLLLILVFSLVGCNNVEKTSKVTLCDYNNIDLSKNNDLNENEYVAKYLLENSTVENYSKEEVEQYVTALEEYYNEYATSLNITFEEYITKTMNQTKEEFYKEAKNAAIEYVKSKDILMEIAKKEKIELTDEDYENYLKELLEYTSYNSLEDFKNNIKENNQEKDMRETAYFEKILEFIIAQNK